MTTILLCFAIFFQPYAGAGFLKRKKRTPKKETSNPAPVYNIAINSSDILADKASYKQCKASVLPSFISISLKGWNITSYNALKALSPPSIIVTGANNDHPDPTSNIKTKASKSFNAIIVGSLSPSGRKSNFSSEGEAVHIMAPADHHQTSAHDDGTYMKFGGTSGATPLVTAGLAGFEWLAGYHPTAEEAKILLEKTAIPTPYSHDRPRKNGVGMLNSYKLGMVGKELRRLCGRDISCFKKMIRNPSIYEFPLDPNLFEAVDQAFPGCSGSCGGKAESCVNKAAVFKRLRKASFLNPSNKKLWTYLSCIYNEGGLTRDAKAMLTTYEALFGPPKNGRPAYDVCQSDSDCVLVPYCKAQNELLLREPPILPYNDGATNAKAEMIEMEESAIQAESRFSKGGNTEYQRFLAPANFQAMTRAAAAIHYATGPCKQFLCNGKCRCDSKETSYITVSSTCNQKKCQPGTKTPYSIATGKCIQSVCVLSEELIPQKPFPISETEPLPPAQEDQEPGSGTR